MTGRQIIDNAIKKIGLNVRKIGVAQMEDYWDRDELLDKLNAVYVTIARGTEFEIVPIFTTVKRQTDSINSFFIEATDAARIREIFYGTTKLEIKHPDDMAKLYGESWTTEEGEPTTAVLTGMYSQSPTTLSIGFTLYPRVVADDTEDAWTDAEIVEFMNTMFTRNFTALDTDFAAIKANFPEKHDQEPVFAYINKTLNIADSATNIPVSDEVAQSLADGVTAMFFEEIPTEPAQVLAKVYSARFRETLRSNRKDEFYKRDRERPRMGCMP